MSTTAVQRIAVLALIGAISAASAQELMNEANRRDLKTSIQETMNDPGLIRTFTKQVRQVYPFIVPNSEEDADTEWVFYYGDGTPSNEDEYESWAAYQAFSWNGGEVDRSHDVDYTEGDTPNDIVDFDVEDTGEVDAARFSLMGCYAHDANSPLFKRKIGNDMSPGDCFAETKANGYMYAAMTTGKQCYASNELDDQFEQLKVMGKACDTECKYTSSMVCGGPNQEKSVYQVDKLTADTRPPVCNSNQYLPSWSTRCIDNPECSENEVAYMGYCHWYDRDAERQLQEEANMGAEVMERFLRASREMKELEAEFNRVRLDFDFNFDPGCAMDEYRTGDGCERCGEWGLQSDDGWSCITVGYMEERRGEFFGTTRNGVKEGRGEFRFREDGSRYSGEFLDDLQMGWGRQYFSNGNSYEGDFRYGEMTYGTYRFTSGKEYNGEFNNGNFSGQGTMYNQDGTWIEGLFRDDDVNGYAVEYGWSDTTYEDYVIYEGDWQDGEYHGYGVKYFDDGTVDYEGDWKGGKPAK